MKYRTWSSAIAVTLLAALAMPLGVGAQDNATQNHHAKHHHYQLAQIPTLGGPGVNFFDNTNNIAVLNAHGVVSGGSADTLIPDPFSSTYWWNAAGNVTKAYLWENGSLTELGSLLDNVNSGSAWISSNGIVAGLSENGQIDPSIPGLPEISPIMWRDGKITNLGTLPGGGYQGAAVSVNNRGEVAGIASNLVPDANSLLNYNPNLWAGVGYGYQLRAFFWDQKNGMQDLGTLGTGTNAEATAINERGQVVGDSYTSSAPGVCYGVTTGGFLWDRRHGMLDLGSFGGTCTIPTDLNSHGQVAGISTVAGDSYQRAFLWEHGSLRDLGGFEGKNTGAIAINEKGEVVGFAQHAVLWKHVGELIDLGTVGSDPCSFAQGINDEDQVVGDSSPSDCVNYDTSRGFLWENGSIADLNTLIPPNSPLYVIYAYTINNRGEIAVNGIDANGIEQAAVLVPCDENHAGVDGCDYSMMDAATAAQSPAPRYPSGAQRLSQLRRTGRSHTPTLVRPNR
jgi:probable HAF family extracellular repeat protein